MYSSLDETEFILEMADDSLLVPISPPQSQSASSSTAAAAAADAKALSPVIATPQWKQVFPDYLIIIWLRNKMLSLIVVPP